MTIILKCVVFVQLLTLVYTSDEDCNTLLILPTNTTLTSTTTRNPASRFGPQQAFLHNKHAWCASLSNADQYLTIDLGLVKMIKSIAIQGNVNNDEFLMTFSVSYAVLDGQWLTYIETGAKRMFKGNSNGGGISKQVFKKIFAARYVRIIPETWHNHVCARVQLFGCHEAPFRALGMTSSTIPNSAVTASSSHSSSFLPYKARLLWTYHGSTQSWCSYYQNVNQWLQIDLSLLEFVTAIATQGRYAINHWVMSYWFSYSNDATSFNEYKDNQGGRKTFTGNSDQHTIVRHTLSPVVYARFVRFNPITWNDHICMRVEVYSYGRASPAELGIGFGNTEVPNENIKVSSAYNSDFTPHQARLNNPLYTYGWCAYHKDSSQWLQFNLGHVMLVTGIVTQPRARNTRQRVTSYKVSYSLDGNDWEFYKENPQSQVKVFQGNVDSTDRQVQNSFNRDIESQYIKIHPVTWYPSGSAICMRASVIGRRRGSLGVPVFTNENLAPSYVTVYKNQHVTLECTAVGDTPITITWTHKGQVLQSKTSDTHLTLTNVNMDQEGFYNCKAINARGTNTRNIYLHIKDSFDICSKYRTLPGKSRLVTSSASYVDDDSNLNETEWYVFMSAKGFSRIPSTCVNQNHCGATAPGYMQEALPKVNEGIVKRKVCFHNNGDCCKYSVDIYVRNCYLFYVYNLKKLDSSWKARYCMEDYTNEIPPRTFQSDSRRPSFAIPSQFIINRHPEVDSSLTCMRYCFLDDNCKSFSFNGMVNVCELNNVTKSGLSTSHQLEVRPDYYYYEAQTLV